MCNIPAAAVLVFSGSDSAQVVTCEVQVVQLPNCNQVGWASWSDPNAAPTPPKVNAYLYAKYILSRVEA